MLARAVFLVLATVGALQAARDAAAASLRTEALRYREEALRTPSTARLSVSAATLLEALADGMGG